MHNIVHYALSLSLSPALTRSIMYFPCIKHFKLIYFWLGQARLKDAQQMGKPQWFPSGTYPAFHFLHTISPLPTLNSNHPALSSIHSLTYPFFINIDSINPNICLRAHFFSPPHHLIIRPEVGFS